MREILSMFLFIMLLKTHRNEIWFLSKRVFDVPKSETVGITFFPHKYLCIKMKVLIKSIIYLDVIEVTTFSIFFKYDFYFL